MEHLLRRPVESRYVYLHRRKNLVWGMLLALVIAGVLVTLLLG